MPGTVGITVRIFELNREDLTEESDYRVTQKSRKEENYIQKLYKVSPYITRDMLYKFLTHS